jgi:hypothetical protein
MSKRICLILYFCIIGSLLIGLSFHPSWGEMHVESTIENRCTVALHVQEKELQNWIPDSMQIVSPRKGPIKSTNLFVIFIEVFCAQNPQGKLAEGGISHNVVFVIPVKHKQSGEMGYLVIHGLTDNPQKVPGAYKAYSLATVHRQLVHSISSFDAGQGSDTWEFKDNSGVLIDYHAQYKQAVPRRAKGVIKIYSGVEPGFFRIYKTDSLGDLVKSMPAKIDRTKDYRLKVSVPKLSKLFDGSEQLVGIIVYPAFVREVFLP